jgi:hypothetical protein
MRAQQMPNPSDHSWAPGMNLPVPMGVIRAAVPSLLIAHEPRMREELDCSTSTTTTPARLQNTRSLHAPALQPPRRSLDKIIVPLTSLTTVKWGAARSLVSTSFAAQMW